MMQNRFSTKYEIACTSDLVKVRTANKKLNDFAGNDSTIFWAERPIVSSTSAVNICSGGFVKSEASTGCRRPERFALPLKMPTADVYETFGTSKTIRPRSFSPKDSRL
ncbi:hypothetical protein C0J52_14659 [Blattella germanica]|nr:hypothetical protein C0J52_14659 [Blattella germanica]